MKMQFENRECIFCGGTTEDVVKSLTVELTQTEMPVTFRLVQDSNGEWSVFRVEGWKPYRNMSCVDKVDGMLSRLERFMKAHGGKTLFLRVEGHMGVRGMNYNLEVA